MTVSIIKAYINNEEVNLVGNIIFKKNRKGIYGSGNVTILNENETRYEPLSYFKAGVEGDWIEYLIQADEPLLLKNGLYEHKITLIDLNDAFKAIIPVSRSFTDNPALTIREIMDIYIEELNFYQGYNITYIDSELFDEKVPTKVYTGSFAEILDDLFRRIKAIVRLSYDYDINLWTISHELYTQRNNEITLDIVGKQSTVNDIDYATEVLAKGSNTINENKYIYFPSNNNYITPRNEGTMFQMSALRYELDSEILDIQAANYKNEIQEKKYYIDYEGAVGNEKFYLDIPSNTYYNVNIISNLVTKDVFNSLESIGDDPDLVYYANTNGSPILVKETCISYDINSKYVDNLFTQITGFLSFKNNIYHLRNAINVNVIYSLKQNAWDDLIDNYLYNSDGSIASNSDKELFKALSAEEIYEMLLLRNLTLFFYTYDDIENIGLQFKYKPRRDIEFITEKYNRGSINKSTILNNQKDSFVDIGSFIDNNNALVNRIGNEINNLTQTISNWSDRLKLGDFKSDLIIINIMYQVERNKIICTFDMAKGFSSTDREYALSRTPSSYVYTGKIVQSNFIHRQYIELYNGDDKYDNTLLTDFSKRICLNIFDYDANYNKPLRHANIYYNNKAIDAVLQGVGSNNTMLWHWSFDDPRVAGYGLIKSNNGASGTYAWYKNPIFYVNEDTFRLDNLVINLSNDVVLKEDNDEIKYYPEVEEDNELYWEKNNYPVNKDINASLAFTHEIIVYSNEDDIIIGNAFSKYNNLLFEFDEEPTLKLYQGLSAYTIFDKYVRDTDVELTPNISLETSPVYKLTVLDALDDTIEYWCLVYNNEIVIAGNNNVSEIKFNFRRDRDYQKDVKIHIRTANFNISTTMSSEYSIPLKVRDANFSITTTLNSEYKKLNLYERITTLSMKTMLSTQFIKGQKGLTSTTNTNYDYTYTDTTPSSLTISEIESSLGIKLELGDVIRVSDGSFPPSYSYYIVEFEE